MKCYYGIKAVISSDSAAHFLFTLTRKFEKPRFKCWSVENVTRTFTLPPPHVIQTTITFEGLFTQLPRFVYLVILTLTYTLRICLFFHSKLFFFRNPKPKKPVGFFLHFLFRCHIYFISTPIILFVFSQSRTVVPLSTKSFFSNLQKITIVRIRNIMLRKDIIFIERLSD